MVIGVVFSGVLAGFAGVVWALAAGLPLLLALTMYPIVGVVGALACISVILHRTRDEDGFSSFGAAQEYN